LPDTVVTAPPVTLREAGESVQAPRAAAREAEASRDISCLDVDMIKLLG